MNVVHGDDLLMLVVLSVRLPNQVVQEEDAATTLWRYMYDAKMTMWSMKTRKKDNRLVS